MPDFQRASELARTFASTTGVEFAEAALVRQFSLAAILSQKPLDAHEVRFPYGFLLDIGGLSPAAADLLRSIVIDALGPMRDELRARGARPNLVAQQVLAAVHGEALERSGFTALDTANDLVAVTAETAAHRSDRHLQWRHSEALLALATTAGTLELIDQAVQFATRLVDAHKSWPLPRVTLARALQLLAAHSGDALVRQRATDAWTNATDLVVNCPEFRRADLGGRSGVFAVEDARGDLSTALVFKPVISRDVGIRESDQLKILREAIAAGSLEDRFGVPRSLGVFPAGPEQHVHVVERQLGRVLSTLEPEEAAEYLAPCVEMLAIYHRAAERPSQNQSGWQSLKRSLKLWARSLFPAPEADDFVNQMKAALPDGLPLVRKRDAHAGNWVIDASNRIIAIDLDGGAFTPVGHDLAQLIEDAAVLPVDRDGFERRHSLFRLYRRGMDLELDSQLLNRAYDWFALYRALWLATSKTASKAQHRHARLLAHHIASTSSLDLLRTPALAAAERMKAASSSRAERDDLTGSQRRLSKAMSRVLRHSAPSLGLMPDDGGFLPLEAVASAVGQPVAAILAVATHPGEPRFQVSDDQIRALYGHSFPVVDLHEINVELPETLYHGTSWDRINQIAERGLSPMSRQHVHLTNNPLEAIEVARRHGRPLLLAVSTAGAGSLRAVADALWASTEVHPSSVQVRNAFAELAAAPSWLTDVGGLEGVGRPRTAR